MGNMYLKPAFVDSQPYKSRKQFTFVGDTVVHMAFSDYLLGGSHAVSYVSCIYQMRMFTARKLVCGWSQDLSILGALANLLSVISSLTYLLSTQIATQCALRSPIYPLIPVSTPILAVESTGVMVNLGLCFFALFEYRHTRNEYQGVSKIFLVLAATIAAAWIWAMHEYHLGILTPLDLLNGVWLLAKYASVASPWPQLVIMSFSELCAGIHKKTWAMDFFGTALLIAGKCLSIYEYAWYSVPYNFSTWMECGSHVLAFIVLTMELWLYKDTYIPLDALKLEGDKDD